MLFQIYFIGDARELPHKNVRNIRSPDVQPSDLPTAGCWLEADIGKKQRLKTGPSTSYPLVHNHEAQTTRVLVDTWQQANLFLGLYPPLIVASLVTNCKIELSDQLINNQVVGPTSAHYIRHDPKSNVGYRANDTLLGAWFFAYNTSLERVVIL